MEEYTKQKAKQEQDAGEWKCSTDVEEFIEVVLNSRSGVYETQITGFGLVAVCRNEVIVI